MGSTDPHDRPLPSSFDGQSDFYENEPRMQKIARKLREEPLIPLGTLLTVAALVNAARATRRGDSATAQRMFRARVAAQGFTVLVMVAGGMYYNKDRQRTAELRKIQQQREAEVKRLGWIRELEARDEESKEMQRQAELRRAQRAAKKAAQAATPPARADGADGGDKKAPSSSGGWTGWLWPGAGEKRTPEQQQQPREGAVAPDKATTPIPAAESGSNERARGRKANPKSALPDLAEIMTHQKKDKSDGQPPK